MKEEWKKGKEVSLCLDRLLCTGKGKEGQKIDERRNDRKGMRN